MTPDHTRNRCTVLRQLRHDHRTLALVILVPPLLLTIMKYVFYGQEEIARPDRCAARRHLPSFVSGCSSSPRSRCCVRTPERSSG